MACSSCGDEGHRMRTRSCGNYFDDIRSDVDIVPDLLIVWNFDILVEAFCLLGHQGEERRQNLIRAMSMGTFGWHMLEQWFDGRLDANQEILVTQGGGSQGPDLTNINNNSYEVRSITANSLNLRSSIDTGGQRPPEWTREQLLSSDYYVFVDRTFFPDPMPVYFVESERINRINNQDLTFLDGSGQTKSYRLARLMIHLARLDD